MINGVALRDSFISAANAVESHKQELNEINVFPVPDGDTGANMTVTMGVAKQMVKRLPDSCTVGEVAKVAAAAMLRGSRGNSGAILALLFRGFARGLAGKETCGAADLVEALKLGVEAAYESVVKPTEGTILTVARECVARGEIYLRRKPTVSAYDMWDFMAYVAKENLKKTPELLSVLAEEEVVDAGAKGFLHILEGMAFAFGGGEVWPEVEANHKAAEGCRKKRDESGCSDAGSDGDSEAGSAGTDCNEPFVFMVHNVTGKLDGEIPVTYRATFELKLDSDQSCVEEQIEKIKERLERLGSSAVVVEQDGVARCQAFTDDIAEIFVFAKETGRMVNFLGTAHSLTRKVQFTAPKVENDNRNADLKYPYCTEFLILKDAEETFDILSLRDFLNQIGDSAVTVDGDDMVKCHVHTDVPELVLAKSFEGGYLTEIKIEDMRA